MTHIEQAIRDAESAGLKLPTGYQFVVATNTRRFGQNTANEMFFMWLLSKPETWQALGKARGWDENAHRNWADNNGRLLPRVTLIKGEEWLFRWHHFIDHLAEDKDSESYFAGI